MTRTSIIPSTTGVYISIPPQYVGREVEVLVFPKSEITEVVEPAKKDIASYRGILSSKESEKMQECITKARMEWAEITC